MTEFEVRGGLRMKFYKEVALCREILAMQSLYDVEQYKMLYNMKDKKWPESDKS